MKKSVLWAGAAGILIVCFGTMAVAVQTAQRTAANNPQMQIAEDAANALNQGTNPKDFVSGKVDFASSLAPFVVIYDKTGQPVAGNGYLNGHLPQVPHGVLTASDGKDFNAVTWQPQPNVRVAAVSTSAHNYYVLSGRSLKEVEREKNVTYLVTGFGLLGTLLILLGTYLMYQRKGK